MGVAQWWKLIRHRQNEKSKKNNNNKNNNSSNYQVFGLRPQTTIPTTPYVANSVEPKHKESYPNNLLGDGIFGAIGYLVQHAHSDNENYPFNKDKNIRLPSWPSKVPLGFFGPIIVFECLTSKANYPIFQPNRMLQSSMAKFYAQTFIPQCGPKRVHRWALSVTLRLCLLFPDNY